MEAYSVNHATPIFFVIYLLFGLYFLQNCERMRMEADAPAVQPANPVLVQ